MKKLITLGKGLHEIVEIQNADGTIQLNLLNKDTNKIEVRFLIDNAIHTKRSDAAEAIARCFLMVSENKELIQTIKKKGLTA